MKGLKIAEQIAKQVEQHHKGQKPDPVRQEAAKPRGPEYKQPEEHQEELHTEDMSGLEGEICPNCHAKLKGIMAKKASHESDPHLG